MSLHKCHYSTYKITRTHARTHARTHTFNGHLSRTTWMSWYQKVKTNLDSTEARESAAVASAGLCKTAPHSRLITIPASHHSVFYRPDALLDAQPTVWRHWRQQQWRQCTYKIHESETKIAGENVKVSFCVTDRLKWDCSWFWAFSGHVVQHTMPTAAGGSGTSPCGRQAARDNQLDQATATLWTGPSSANQTHDLHTHMPDFKSNQINRLLAFWGHKWLLQCAYMYSVTEAQTPSYTSQCQKLHIVVLHATACIR